MLKVIFNDLAFDEQVTMKVYIYMDEVNIRQGYL